MPDNISFAICQAKCSMWRRAFAVMPRAPRLGANSSRRSIQAGKAISDNSIRLVRPIVSFASSASWHGTYQGLHLETQM